MFWLRVQIERDYRQRQGKDVLKKKTSSFIAVGTVVVAIIGYISKKKNKKETYTFSDIPSIKQRELGLYEKYIKRGLDVVCATVAIVAFWPLYLGIAIAVKLKMGSPVIFIQERPGLIGTDGKETLFRIYKFRSMSDQRDNSGKLLSDEERLGKFGKWLRSTSLDELPEVFNILNGTMSVVGPRPQLVRDMLFMTEEQRMRHTAKPGLSGLAQINGRNGISWEKKIEWDLKYVKKVSLLEDIRIVFQTIWKAFVKQEGITENDMATAEDYGDYLLRTGKINQKDYIEKQEKAKHILEFY